MKNFTPKNIKDITLADKIEIFKEVYNYLDMYNTTYPELYNLICELKEEEEEGEEITNFDEWDEFIYRIDDSYFITSNATRQYYYLYWDYEI